MKLTKRKRPSDDFLIDDSLIRPNNVPVTSPNQLIFGTNLNYSSYYARSGQVYTACTGSISVSANGFLVLQLTNPAHSGKILYINRISGGATTNTTFDMLKNATFSATGTPITPQNTNWNFSNSSAATIKYLSQGTDPTTGGTNLISIIQTGGPLILDYGGLYIIPYGPTDRELYLRLTNNTNQVNILSINITWWEI